MSSFLSIVFAQHRRDEIGLQATDSPVPIHVERVGSSRKNGRKGYRWNICWGKRWEIRGWGKMKWKHSTRATTAHNLAEKPSAHFSKTGRTPKNKLLAPTFFTQTPLENPPLFYQRGNWENITSFIPLGPTVLIPWQRSGIASRCPKWKVGHTQKPPCCAHKTFQWDYFSIYGVETIRVFSSKRFNDCI